MKTFILLTFFLSVATFAHAQLSIGLIDETIQSNPAVDLAATLAGSGVTVISGSEYVSMPGIFSDDPTARGFGTFGFGPNNTTTIPDSGVILSTGDVRDAVGPNDSDNTSTTLDTYDSAFNLLGDFGATEGTRLSFQFKMEDPVLTEKDLFFQFVFASEEYNEWVSTGLNDGFALVLSELDASGNVTNATDLAQHPFSFTPSGTDDVNVDNINNSVEAWNNFPGHFYDNDPGLDFGEFPPSDGVPFPEIEYDGFSSLLTAQTTINTNQIYQIDFLIFDVLDTSRDSAVFLTANSFSAEAPGGSGGNVGGVIPEPSTIGGFALFGLAGFLYWRRRRNA